jgi:sodium/hydrogen exchanger-like protein 3
MSHKLEESIPESCVLMMLGLVCGGILWGCGINYQMHPDIFFLYFLPPIILDAGYHMPNRAFFDNIGSVLLFAIIGTLFNTITIGFSIWGMTQTGGLGAIPLRVEMLHCLTLAALLSAVDPVAVIAVFEEVHVHDILYIVVFGESLLNDGVAVVCITCLYYYLHIYIYMVFFQCKLLSKEVQIICVK